jgi:hypothetical protein
MLLSACLHLNSPADPDRQAGPSIFPMDGRFGISGVYASKNREAASDTRD